MHRNHPERRTIGQVALFVTLALGLAQARAATPSPLQEAFETGDALKGWKVQTSDSDARASIVSPGQFSDHCLQITKPDTCGMILLQRQVPATAGHWLRLTADVRTLFKGAYAKFYFMVTPLAGAKPKGPNQFFAFNDSISRSSIFGGQNKTPQTLGEWRRNENLFQVPAGVDSLRLTLVISEGAQTIQFDNVQLEDVGTTKPPRGPRQVFGRRIDWPYAMIDLDSLAPGCVYKVVAGYRQPDADPKIKDGLTPNAKLSPERPPTDATGMGVSMSTTDDRGQTTLVEQLQPLPDENGAKVYRLVMPHHAVTAHLNFYNDDMVRYDHNQLAAQARRWTDVRIYLESYGEVTADNAYYQWLYRGKPPQLKPRTVFEPDAYDLQALKAHLAARPPAQVRLENHKGGMRLILDGKPAAPMFASRALGQPGEAGFRRLAENGIKVFFVRYPYGGPAIHGGWTGPGAYDFSDLDAAMYQTLAQAPDGYLILSISNLYPPDWWADQHLDQVMRDQNGLLCWSPKLGIYDTYWGTPKEIDAYRTQSAENLYIHSRGAKWNGHYVYSTASTASRRTIAEFLTAMRRHIESMPYGRAVIGYRLCWGYDTQWGMPHDNWTPGGEHVVDYSAPMVERFRQFVQDKYKTIDALRNAWGEASLTFDQVKPPGIAQRNVDQYKARSYLLDPSRDQAVIDYRQCLSRCVGEQFVGWAAAVKDAGKRPTLVMAYYPDISESCAGGPVSQRGYEVVMPSSAVDAVGGPSYEGRDIGLNNKSTVMLSSCVLHDKLHLEEMDHRLFPVIKRNYANNLIFDTPRKSISVLQREYMKQMCFGSGSWTFDMGMGWFNDPMIARVIGDAQKVFESVLDKDRTSIAKMAMFAGVYGKNVQADARRGAIPKMLVSTTKVTLYQAGVPIDQYQLRDLPAVAGRYKVFYFPFAYALTDQQRDWINSLKKDGNLLVFGYGAGYVSSHDQSIRNVEALTGMHMSEAPGMHLTLRITDDKNPITRDVRGFMGDAGEKGFEAGLPRFYVDDPEAVTLGRFVGTDQHAGLALKDHGTWQSVYIGSVGIVPPGLLRGLARYKQLPVYNQSDDVMYFNHSLIAIHASTDGLKRIELPEPADVTSLWDHKFLGRVRTIDRPMRTGDNALYLIQN